MRERYLRENNLSRILEILRHVVGKLHQSWEDWLPHVAASINESVNSSTGKTPHYIVFGEDKRLPYDIHLLPERLSVMRKEPENLVSNLD